ncbi:MAG TPA: HAD family hydrolase [Thermodesulfobacteriota bacterium]|nr:HAD family hydrolase [Thermodesulfobacteriota bacterium]
MKLLLFDIDGTILNSGGAAIRAINRVFMKIYLIENAMDGIRADGKTDFLILRDMFNKSMKRDFLLEETEAILKDYILFLEEEIAIAESFRIMPGIAELLDALSRRKDLILGIATGNIEQGAWIKLRRSKLDSYFKFGGFGSDSENREKLIRVAVERAKALVNRTQEFERIFVIGDTPFDIIHGRAAGAKTVAVATGSYSVNELKEYNPDYLFESFLEFESVIKIFY